MSQQQQKHSISKIRYLGSAIVEIFLVPLEGISILAGKTLDVAGIDNVFVKYPNDGLPYIPGSSLKGLLRSAAELTENGEYIVYKGEKEEIGKPKDPFDDDCEARKKSPLLRLFGSPEPNRVIGPTRALFNDLLLSTNKVARFEDKVIIANEQNLERQEKFRELKTETAINRLTGKVQSGALRTTERITRGAVFEGPIYVRFFQLERDPQCDNRLEVESQNLIYLLEILDRVNKHFNKLGYSKSRGYGRFKLLIKDIKFIGIDGKERKLLSLKRTMDDVVDVEEVLKNKDELLRRLKDILAEVSKG